MPTLPTPHLIRCARTSRSTGVLLVGMLEEGFGCDEEICALEAWWYCFCFQPCKKSSGEGEVKDFCLVLESFGWWAILDRIEFI